MSADKDKKPAVLIAEDEEINRAILREILKDKYRILEAENGHQAVFCIQAEETEIALIILDIHMPKLDGFGVMEYLQETGLNNKIPVVVTTSDKSADVLVQAKKNHAVDIVYKPFRAAEIRKIVDNLVQICKLETSLESIIEEKSVYFTNQYEALKKAAKALRRVKWEDNIKSLMSKLLPGNEAHSGRIRVGTELLLDGLMERYPKYGLSKSINKAISDATLLHDIGNVIIPDSLFDGHRASAGRAMVQIKKRPIAGSELINLMFVNSTHQLERKYAYEIARYMYEQYDGKGYPIGVVGDEIPICAQVVSLCHRYDEIRFLKDGTVKPHKSVMRKIQEAEYKAYNPDLLEVFEVLSDTFDKTVMEEYNKNKEK